MKVAFQLEQNEDGYPPVALETLNASDLGGGLFKIENAPFFAESIAYGDVVAARASTSGSCAFDKVVERSTFTSLSILILQEGMDVLLMDLFRGKDCVIEYGEFGDFRVLAVAVPKTCDYAALRATLQTLEDDDQISFAELAVA